jgi:hypothetical protein
LEAVSLLDSVFSADACYDFSCGRHDVVNVCSVTPLSSHGGGTRYNDREKTLGYIASARVKVPGEDFDVAILVCYKPFDLKTISSCGRKRGVIFLDYIL